MTTEQRPPKREPRWRVSALELRLYVVALLAAVYTISWRAIGGQAAGAPAAAEPPRSARIERAPQAAQPARVVRVPKRRVRTRSS